MKIFMKTLTLILVIIGAVTLNNSVVEAADFFRQIRVNLEGLLHINSWQAPIHLEQHAIFADPNEVKYAGAACNDSGFCQILQIDCTTNILYVVTYRNGRVSDPVRLNPPNEVFYNPFIRG